MGHIVSANVKGDVMAVTPDRVGGGGSGLGRLFPWRAGMEAGMLWRCCDVCTESAVGDNIIYIVAPAAMRRCHAIGSYVLACCVRASSALCVCVCGTRNTQLSLFRLL